MRQAIEGLLHNDKLNGDDTAPAERLVNPVIVGGGVKKRAAPNLPELANSDDGLGGPDRRSAKPLRSEFLQGTSVLSDAIAAAEASASAFAKRDDSDLPRHSENISPDISTKKRSADSEQLVDSFEPFSNSVLNGKRNSFLDQLESAIHDPISKSSVKS